MELQAGKHKTIMAQRWILVSDDDGHDYCIPAEKQDQFREWVESDEYESDYRGPDYAGYALGGSPTQLTFENPQYQGKDWPH